MSLTKNAGAQYIEPLQPRIPAMTSIEVGSQSKVVDASKKKS